MIAVNRNNKIHTKFKKTLSFSYKIFSPTGDKILTAVLTCFTLFQLYASISNKVPLQILRYTHLGFAICLAYLIYPAFKHSDRSKEPWYDVLLAFLFKSPNPDALNITLRAADEAAGTEAIVLGLGTFIGAIINFLVIALVLFSVIKAINKALKELKSDGTMDSLEKKWFGTTI